MIHFRAPHAWEARAYLGKQNDRGEQNPILVKRQTRRAASLAVSVSDYQGWG